MKAFVSGQINEKENVRSVYAELQSLGFEITYDWTRTDDCGDKHLNSRECGERAAKDIGGVVASDVYLLMSDNRSPGKGMYAELGAALALREVTGKPDIYLVGPMNHLSIFYLHPSILRFDAVSQLIDHLRQDERFSKRSGSERAAAS